MIGKFQIKTNFYSTTTLKYLTGIELQICLNQLIFAFILSTQKEVSNDMNNLQINNSYIVRIDTKFKQRIKSSKDLIGKIELLNTAERKKAKTKFFKFKFSFEEDKCTGVIMGPTGLGPAAGVIDTT